MTFEESQERARDYHRRPEYYRKRNVDIAKSYQKYGDGLRLAKKYAITPQRVQQIAKRHGARIAGGK